MVVLLIMKMCNNSLIRLAVRGEGVVLYYICNIEKKYLILGW